MDELYLILHKVRGQAAIDVATRVHLSGGDCIWWIPTSGHRAWPLRWQPLTESLSADSLSAVQIEGDDWERLPGASPLAGSAATRTPAGFANGMGAAGDMEGASEARCRHQRRHSVVRQGGL
jgi:hypothetical protein